MAILKNGQRIINSDKMYYIMQFKFLYILLTTSNATESVNILQEKKLKGLSFYMCNLSMDSIYKTICRLEERRQVLLVDLEECAENTGVIAKYVKEWEHILSTIKINYQNFASQIISERVFINLVLDLTAANMMSMREELISHQKHDFIRFLNIFIWAVHMIKSLDLSLSELILLVNKMGELINTMDFDEVSISNLVKESSNNFKHEASISK